MIQIQIEANFQAVSALITNTRTFYLNFPKENGKSEDLSLGSTSRCDRLENIKFVYLCRAIAGFLKLLQNTEDIKKMSMLFSTSILTHFINLNIF